MNWFEFAKTVAGFVTSTTVGMVVNNAIITTTPKNQSRMNNLGVAIGGLIISSLVADIATERVTQKMDELKTKLDKTLVETPSDK